MFRGRKPNPKQEGGPGDEKLRREAAVTLPSKRNCDLVAPLAFMTASDSFLPQSESCDKGIRIRSRIK